MVMDIMNFDIPVSEVLLKFWSNFWWVWKETYIQTIVGTAFSSPLRLNGALRLVKFCLPLWGLYSPSQEWNFILKIDESELWTLVEHAWRASIDTPPPLRSASGLTSCGPWWHTNMKGGPCITVALTYNLRRHVKGDEGGGGSIFLRPIKGKLFPPAKAWLLS